MKFSTCDTYLLVEWFFYAVYNSNLHWCILFVHCSHHHNLFGVWIKLQVKIIYMVGLCMSKFNTVVLMCYTPVVFHMNKAHTVNMEIFTNFCELLQCWFLRSVIFTYGGFQLCFCFQFLKYLPILTYLLYTQVTKKATYFVNVRDIWTFQKRKWSSCLFS